MSAPATPRAIAWSRRGATLAESWRVYRRDRGGLVGLALLVVIVALAVLAPALTDGSGLNVTRVDAAPL